MRGYRVLFVTGMYPVEENPTNGHAVYYQIESLKQRGVHADIYHLYAKPRRSFFQMLADVKEKAVTGKYDAIHLHYGIKATLLSLFAPVPVIATYHGTDINGVTLAGGQRLTFGLAVNSAARVTRFLTRKLAAVIVMTEAMKMRLPRSVQQRTYVIPMGIDTEKFSPVPKAEARTMLGWGNEPVIAFADNNNEPVKRLDLAQKAIERVQQQIPDARLFIMRRLEHDRIPVVLAAADCLLITSDREGAPNILREAIACGLPVVSVAVGDVPDILRKYEGTGCIVSREPEDIASGIVATVKLPERTVHQDARHEISLQTVAERVLSVYRQVLPSGEKKDSHV